jgi:hypothetical protein
VLSILEKTTRTSPEAGQLTVTASFPPSFQVHPGETFIEAVVDACAGPPQRRAGQHGDRKYAFHIPPAC